MPVAVFVVKILGITFNRFFTSFTYICKKVFKAFDAVGIVILNGVFLSIERFLTALAVEGRVIHSGMADLSFLLAELLKACRDVSQTHTEVCEQRFCNSILVRFWLLRRFGFFKLLQVHVCLFTQQ